LDKQKIELLPAYAGGSFFYSQKLLPSFQHLFSIIASACGGDLGQRLKFFG